MIIYEGLGRLADTGFALRFLRLMTMPVEKTAAFKTGVIDKNYLKIKKPETPEEKNAYTLFHRLVFNIKRLIRKLPFGKLTVSSYLAALWLVKENTDMSDEEIGSVLREATGIDPNTIELAENNLFINNDGYLQEGTYILNKELLLPFTGENLIQKGSSIVVNENTQPCGSIFNVPVFKVWHEKTKSNVYVTQEDIQDV